MVYAKRTYIALGLVLYTTLNLTAAVKVYVVPAVSDDKILPESILSERLVSQTVSLTACRGEFEPASFVLKSDVDVNELCVTASDLTRQGGMEVISADHVDIRVVKCWYQAGYSIKDLTHKHVTPELLVKDDTLVYMSEGLNYLKLTPNNGNPYFVNISDPEIKNYREIVSINDFPVRDAVSLRPVSLISGQNKQFWITVKVPDNAISGTYTGTITLMASGICKTITLTVWVPEITLPFPSLKYSIYYRGILNPTGSISSERKNVTQFTAEMRNLFNHGVTMPTVYGVSYLRDTLAIRANEHIDNNTLYFLGYHIDTPNLVSLWPSLINTVTPYGVNEVYLYGLDEQDHDTPAIRAQIAAVHALGAKVFVAQYYWQALKVADVLDLAVVDSAPNTELADLYHGYGHKVFSYYNPPVGEENPAKYRRNYGLLLWRNGYDGVMNYAYQDSFGNIWNDFDHSLFRDHNFTYPTVDGVIDTLSWEGFREGVDDVRYLTALEDQIEQVMQNDQNDLKMVAQQARNWLAMVDVNGNPDAIRSKTIQYILRLKGLPCKSKVGHWRFDEAGGSTIAKDSSGCGNDGVLVNMDAQTAWVDGRVEGGLSLNNGTTGQYVDCGYDESLNICDEITVTAWVKASELFSQVIYVGSPTTSRFRINVNTKMNLWVNTQNEGWHTGGTGSVHDWTGWHHIAWTYDSTTNLTKFYFDGNEDYSSTTISTGLLASEPIQFVRIGGGENNYYFHGELDDVRIYHRALVDEEIGIIFNGGLLPEERISGDANGDDRVDVGDLGILAANYGQNLQSEGIPFPQWWGRGDFNSDGKVDVGDLGILAANYGTGATSASWETDYAMIFGDMAMEEKVETEYECTFCGLLGLPVIVSLILMSLLVKLRV
jgi:hypothetical protein